ncbi:hypothetical protein [Mesobacillus campisalis]|uniref:hypothetical protein n=1 Tax=Mesobacillus campisalis TaxID=1408103 RepID=UPI000AF16FA6|nr:hypothetical protein [Mesobacillus campisalis]
MQKQRIWLSLLASAGIGAAAFYSMNRGNNVGQVAKNFVPLVTGISGQNQKGQ